MSFLAVLISVIFYRHWVGDNPLRENFPVSAWFDWIFKRSGNDTSRFILAVVLPSLLLLWMTVQLNHGLAAIIWLALAVLTLLYCIEIVDIDLLIDDQLMNTQKLADDADLQASRQGHDNFITDLVMDVFESLVPAMFWFLLLGPAGAVFYLLSDNFLQRTAADDDLSEWLETLIFGMQWLPARVTLLLFALVGDFAMPWKAFVSSLSDFERSASEVVTPVITAALLENAELATSVQGFSQQAEDSLIASRDLLERSLWGWVAIAAGLAIFGF